MLAPPTRAQAMETLSQVSFDLLVIGGGVIGARIALEAALAGDRVALVDARDFGSATSSASSKLIHGGLRYLQMGDLGLVRESHVERRALLERVAPHLVWPMTFVLPVYRGGPHLAPVVGAGLLLYSALSGFRRSRARLVRTGRALELIPSMRTERLGWCGVYQDAQTNDARLVLATVTAAARAGATVLNHAEVTGLESTSAEISTIGGERFEVRFKAAVNAAGPWVDRVRRLASPAAVALARLSKGVHVTMPLPPGWGAALTVPIERQRVAFAVPWEGTLLLGTTDTEYGGDPGDLHPDEEDVTTVLAEAAAGLPPELLVRERVLHSFAGLRVLPAGEGDTAGARREHVVEVGRGGLVSVAGGKLTTHRRIAIDVLRRLDAARYQLHEDPLPGAGPVAPRDDRVDGAVWANLVRHFGSDAAAVLDAGSAERIHPDGPDVWAQVAWAVAREWALTPEDVVRRRTTLQLRGLDSPELRRRIEAEMQPAG